MRKDVKFGEVDRKLCSSNLQAETESKNSGQRGAAEKIWFKKNWGVLSRPRKRLQKLKSRRG